MKKTILVLVASVAGFITVWRFEPAPVDSGSSAATVQGSAESSRYGTVQVRLVRSGGKITDLQLLREPTSGATLTSESYVNSLHAALDAR